MNNTLPEGWILEKLNNVVEFIKTGVDPYDGEIEYFSTGSISENEIQIEGSYSFENKPSRANRISEINDILQARMKETNKALIIEDNLNNKLFSTGFMQYRIISNTLHSKFLYYYIKSDNYLNQRDEYATGSTQISLNDMNAKKIIISLPPLAEQKRVAIKLDAVLPRVEKLKERLQKTQEIIKQFRKSVLNAAVTGKLTEEWRKKKEFDSWETTNLESIISSGPQNGLYKSQEYYGTGTLILRIDNFYDGFVNSWNTLKRINLTNKETESYQLSNDDIVINRVNSMAYLGKSALIRNLVEKCVFESNMMRFTVKKEKVNPEFLIKYLNSKLGLNELRKNAKHAVNQSSINQNDVKSTILNIPPLEEQHEIVRRVEALFGLADKLEKRLSIIIERVEDLGKSVLAKAFRGELVPTEAELAEQEGRSYETAEDLLKRIKAEKKKLEAERKKNQRNGIITELTRN